MTWAILKPFAPWFAGAALAISLVLYGRHEAHRADAAEAALRQAQAQVVVKTATAQATDKAATQTIILQSKAEKAQDAIHKAPGADAPLSDAVRDAWLSGLRDLDAQPSDQPAR